MAKREISPAARAGVDRAIESLRSADGNGSKDIFRAAHSQPRHRDVTRYGVEQSPREAYTGALSPDGDNGGYVPTALFREAAAEYRREREAKERSSRRPTERAEEPADIIVEDARRDAAIRALYRIAELLTAEAVSLARGEDGAAYAQWLVSRLLLHEKAAATRSIYQPYRDEEGRK